MGALVLVLFFQKRPKSNFHERTALCFVTFTICCLNAPAQLLELSLHPLQLPGCDAGLSLQAGTAPTEIPWA